MKVCIGTVCRYTSYIRRRRKQFCDKVHTGRGRNFRYLLKISNSIGKRHSIQEIISVCTASSRVEMERVEKKLGRMERKTGKNCAMLTTT